MINVLIWCLAFVTGIAVAISSTITRWGAQSHDLTVDSPANIPKQLSWVVYLAFTTISSSVISQVIHMGCMRPDVWEELSAHLSLRHKEFKRQLLATLARFVGTFLYFFTFLVLQVNEIATLSCSQLVFHNIIYVLFKKRYPSRFEVFGFSLLGFGMICLVIPQYQIAVAGDSVGRSAIQLTIGITSLQVAMLLFGISDYVVDHLNETVKLYAVSLMTSFMMFILFFITFLTQLLVSFNQLTTFWPDWMWIGTVNGQTLMFYFLSYMFAMYRSSENLVTFLILHRIYVIASLVLDYLILETGLGWYNVLGCVLVSIGSVIATWSHKETEEHSIQPQKPVKGQQHVPHLLALPPSSPASVASSPAVHSETKTPHYDLLDVSREVHPLSHPVLQHKM